MNNVTWSKWTHIYYPLDLLAVCPFLQHYAKANIWEILRFLKLFPGRNIFFFYFSSKSILNHVVLKSRNKRSVQKWQQSSLMRLDITNIFKLVHEHNRIISQFNGRIMLLVFLKPIKFGYSWANCPVSVRNCEMLFKSKWLRCREK